MNLKRFSIVSVRSHKPSRKPVLASVLTVNRPELVTLLKLTLLSVVVFAAAPPMKHDVLKERKVKITSSKLSWRHFVQGEKFTRKKESSTKKLVLFHNPSTGEFSEIIKGGIRSLTGIIELPLKNVEKAKRQTLLTLTDDADAEFQLDFKNNDVRNQWYNSIWQHNEIYKHFWNTVLWDHTLAPNLYDNFEISLEAALGENLRTLRNRELFALEFRRAFASMRYYHDTVKDKWRRITGNFKQCSLHLQKLMMSSVEGLLNGATADARSHKCILPFFTLRPTGTCTDKQRVQLDNNIAYISRLHGAKNFRELKLWQNNEMWKKLSLDIFRLKSNDCGSGDRKAIKIARNVINSIIEEVFLSLNAQEIPPAQCEKKIRCIRTEVFQALLEKITHDVGGQLDSGAEEVLNSTIERNDRRFEEWLREKIPRPEPVEESPDMIDFKFDEEIPETPQYLDDGDEAAIAELEARIN